MIIDNIVVIIFLAIWFKFSIDQMQKFLKFLHFTFQHKNYRKRELFWIYLSILIILLLGPLTIKFNKYL